MPPARKKPEQDKLVVEKSSPDGFQIKPIGEFSASVSNSNGIQESFQQTNKNILSSFGNREEQISSAKKEEMQISQLKEPGNIELKTIDEEFGNEEKEKQNEITLENKEIKGKELRFISKPNSSTLMNLLENNICTVDFVRVTRPQIERIMRCTVGDQFIPSNISGLGYGGGRIIVWDLDKRGYRSFYPDRVIQISYEEDQK
jgi:hypothetical protein